ncbi:MAG: hypothetical protein ACK47D_10005 [Pseudanabaena sp.]|jgi:hypothetical protein
MITIGKYQVNIKTPLGIKNGFIEEANLEDMPKKWDFNWLYIWTLTDFEVQKIVKLVYENKVYGLVRFSEFEIENISVIEIEQLEAISTSRYGIDLRLVDPIGKWLIWYVAKIALENKNIKNSEPLIYLSAKLDAVDYYRDAINMEYIGNPYRSTGDEDGYAFKFTREQAESFCSNQERKWGKPTPFKPYSSKSRV